MSIRGYPSKLYSDNGAQLVAANKELTKVIKDLDSKSLQQFGVTQGLKWIFIGGFRGGAEGAVAPLFSTTNTTILL